MSAGDGPPTGAARSVVRAIDRELDRLDKLDKAVACERELPLSARAALTGNGRAGPGLRRRISHNEIVAYLCEHQGSSADQVADALQAAATSVSTQLHRGKYTRYESRGDGWYRRSRPN